MPNALDGVPLPLPLPRPPRLGVTEEPVRMLLLVPEPAPRGVSGRNRWAAVATEVSVSMTNGSAVHMATLKSWELCLE